MPGLCSEDGTYKACVVCLSVCQEEEPAFVRGFCLFLLSLAHTSNYTIAQTTQAALNGTWVRAVQFRRLPLLPP
jgi:hypothetical protein